MTKWSRRPTGVADSRSATHGRTLGYWRASTQSTKHSAVRRRRSCCSEPATTSVTGAIYQNLACISVAQLYRLRASRAYRERRIKYQATKPTPLSIGGAEKTGAGRAARLPAHRHGASGRSGWAFLLPMLEGMLAQFPFRIGAFISTTAASTSITWWLSCCADYSLNQTSPIRDAPQSVPVRGPPGTPRTPLACERPRRRRIAAPHRQCESWSPPDRSTRPAGRPPSFFVILTLDARVLHP